MSTEIAERILARVQRSGGGFTLDPHHPALLGRCRRCSVGAVSPTQGEVPEKVTESSIRDELMMVHRVDMQMNHSVDNRQEASSEI